MIDIEIISLLDSNIVNLLGGSLALAVSDAICTIASTPAAIYPFLITLICSVLPSLLITISASTDAAPLYIRRILISVCSSPRKRNRGTRQLYRVTYSLTLQIWVFAKST